MLSREGKSSGGRTLPLPFPEEEGPGAAALLLCAGCPSIGERAWLWYVVATSRVGWTLPGPAGKDWIQWPGAWANVGGEGGARGSLGARFLGQLLDQFPP